MIYLQTSLQLIILIGMIKLPQSSPLEKLFLVLLFSCAGTFDQIIPTLTKLISFGANL